MGSRYGTSTTRSTPSQKLMSAAAACAWTLSRTSQLRHFKQNVKPRLPRFRSFERRDQRSKQLSMITILNNFLCQTSSQQDLPNSSVAATLTSKSVHSWPLNSHLGERLCVGGSECIQALASGITDARMGVLEHRSYEAVDAASLHFRYPSMRRKTNSLLYNFAELELHHLNPINENESKTKRVTAYLAGAFSYGSDRHQTCMP